MDSKWEKLNPLLFHKIKDYNRELLQNHHQITQFQNSLQHLFTQIQQNALKHQSRYNFPRKIHDNPNIINKEDAPLAQQLSTTTYNLYHQNSHHQSHRQTRFSSFHTNKPIIKHSFIVRKNPGLDLSKDQQKRIPSQNSRPPQNPIASRVVRNSCENRSSARKKEYIQLVPVKLGMTRVKINHKEVNTPKTIKKQSILLRNDSSSSFNSHQQNNKQQHLSINRLKTTGRSKFNQAKLLPRLTTDCTND